MTNRKQVPDTDRRQKRRSETVSPRPTLPPQPAIGPAPGTLLLGGCREAVLKDVLSLSVVVLITSLVCVLGLNRVLYSYARDALESLSWLKAASEGCYAPFADHTNYRLGAPTGANWNDYPMYDTITIWLFGSLSRWTGLLAAAGAMVWFGHVTSAMGCFAACRMLQIRRIWAVAFALVWAFSYYHVFRGFRHVILAIDGLVPVAVACSWMMINRPVLWGRFFWICASVGLFLGQANPYNLNMWVQLVCLSTLVRVLAEWRPKDLLFAFSILSVTFVTFLASNLHYLLDALRYGANPGSLTRAYFMTELYALKPIEMFLPPPNHPLAALTHTAQYAKDAWVKGEMFSPYLGVIGIVGLVWLIAEAVVGFARSLPQKPYALLQCVWITLYSVIGGANCVLGLFGILYWRGSNRFSIWILCIVLLFLASKLNRLNWSSPKVTLAGVALVMLALLDQFHPPQLPAGLAEELASDQKFGRLLEQQLPGEAVFQLPIMTFIDANPVGNCDPYDLVRPYLWTRTVRFSHGRLLGRPEDAWRSEVLKGGAPRLIGELKERGFTALYLTTKAFPDAGKSLLQALASLGYNHVLEDDLHEQVCVLLR